MKKAVALFGFIFLMVLSLVAVAQVSDPGSVINNVDAFQAILATLTSGDLKGLTLVAAIIQAVMYALRSQIVVDKLGATKAPIRLVVVLLLSLVGGVVALMKDGMPLAGALLHSTTLAAFQVLFHQLYSQFIEPKLKKTA